MTVYVDDMLRPARVGRIQSRWSHLLADTHDELMAFAARMQLRPEWLQHEGTRREHFDLTEPRRIEALRLGAIPISYPRETGALLTRKREELADPAWHRDCEYCATWPGLPCATHRQMHDELVRAGVVTDPEESR